MEFGILDTTSLVDVIRYIDTKTVVFPVLGVIIAFATWWFNRQVGKRTMAKLALDEQTSTDRHILALCQALSDRKQSLQLAAAALLVDRARTTDERGRNRSERVAILQALLAATMDDKRTQSQQPASADLCKYIADSIVDVLNARTSRENRLSDFYWQQVRLSNADWKDVNAEGLDLFGAVLDRASLRRANLKGTVLNRACLRAAVLCGANLSKVDLRGADLSDADLRACSLTSPPRPTQLAGAKLHGANLTGAKLDGVDLTHVSFDSDTRWPEGFKPRQILESPTASKSAGQAT